MAQRQVEVRNADSMETMEGKVSSATKRKLTPEKARVGFEDKVSLFFFTHFCYALPLVYQNVKRCNGQMTKPN